MAPPLPNYFVTIIGIVVGKLVKMRRVVLPQGFGEKPPSLFTDASGSLTDYFTTLPTVTLEVFLEVK